MRQRALEGMTNSATLDRMVKTTISIWTTFLPLVLNLHVQSEE